MPWIIAGGALLGGALSSRGSRQQDVTQTSAPWGPQQPYLLGGFQRAQNILNQPFNYAPNAMQLGGQDLMTQYAGSPGLANLIGGAQGALGFSLSPNILSPTSNPYLAQYGDALMRPITRNLTENMLPAIRSQAMGAGQYGGTRQGIAEGLAIGRTNEVIGDRLAQLYGGAYGQGLEQMSRGMQLAPGVAAMGQLPGNLMSQVGGEQYAQQLNQQQIPWWQLQQYMNAIGGNVGNTQTQPYFRNPTAEGLGAAGSILGGARLLGWPGFGGSSGGYGSSMAGGFNMGALLGGGG